MPPLLDIVHRPRIYSNPLGQILLREMLPSPYSTDRFTHSTPNFLIILLRPVIHVLINIRKDINVNSNFITPPESLTKNHRGVGKNVSGGRKRGPVFRAL